MVTNRTCILEENGIEAWGCEILLLKQPIVILTGSLEMDNSHAATLNDRPLHHTHLLS